MFTNIIFLICLPSIILCQNFTSNSTEEYETSTESINSTITTPTSNLHHNDEIELTWIGFGVREDGDEIMVWDKRMFNSSRDLTSCFTFKYDSFRFTFANLTTTDVRLYHFK